MGIVASMISNALNRMGTKESRILVLGLDAAGKTTLLYKLKVGEAVTTIPTIGFNVETVNYKRCSFTAWDIGGQEKLRRLWSHYYRGADALVYVVDSADADRMNEAAEELQRTLSHPDMRDCHSVLVYANKQDLPGALCPADVAKTMDVASAAGASRKWWVQGAVSTTGSGLYEGLDWLADRVIEASA